MIPILNKFSIILRDFQARIWGYLSREEANGKSHDSAEGGKGFRVKAAYSPFNLQLTFLD